MYSKFNTLEPEKRERIINAAIEEFARNGYEKASTNEIIKAAQIFKGALFNYFNSKKDLYLFLFEYIVSVIEKIYDVAVSYRQKGGTVNVHRWLGLEKKLHLGRGYQ